MPITNPSKPSSFPSFTLSAVFFCFFCLSCVFFALTWQLVALNHLSVLLHCVYKPFLATTSSPASQGRLLLTPSQTVLIFTRLWNTGRHRPWGDSFVLLGGKPVLVFGLKHNPTNQILQCLNIACCSKGVWGIGGGGGGGDPHAVGFCSAGEFLKNQDDRRIWVTLYVNRSE